MPNRGVVYYTDGKLDARIFDLVVANLRRATDGLDIVCVYPQPSAILGVKQMFCQIRDGLERSTADHVFLCEHDVIYHPSHFEFVPLRDDTFYYNVNVWHVRWPDGRAVYWDNCQQVSGLCAARALLLDFYRRRIEQVEREGFNRHYEPGLKQTVGGRRVENWQSAGPNLDIRHGSNLTASKWHPSDFRNPQNARGWREVDKMPGWDEIIAGVQL